ncbi:hypothetical protein [Ureibacillus aquaedulcis]|uniref:Uncharacterized protein n=1 Tax=Ureibacillus aquaedulcis TaxID=3058421 RepID=A0ABT8GN95_9BACL|nr:hypothetical protein [Ureibacillus sp. BA0131]MDN4492879.1 hypothetical protein [Ureibacillus sp. BA0131]
MKKILRNDYLVTWLLGIGVIALLVGIGVGFVYSLDKATEDPFQERIAERNRELAEIRAKSFERTLKCED